LPVYCTALRMLGTACTHHQISHTQISRSPVSDRTRRNMPAKHMPISCAQLRDPLDALGCSAVTYIVAEAEHAQGRRVTHLLRGHSLAHPRLGNAKNTSCPRLADIVSALCVHPWCVVLLLRMAHEDGASSGGRIWGTHELIILHQWQRGADSALRHEDEVMTILSHRT
jgi:hypothetical protein